jgi:hypothetical protein
MTNETNVFVRVRTMRDECESCRMNTPTMFRLFDDANGAIICSDCANEFGRIHTWEDAR